MGLSVAVVCVIQLVEEGLEGDVGEVAQHEDVLALLGLLVRNEGEARRERHCFEVVLELDGDHRENSEDHHEDEEAGELRHRHYVSEANSRHCNDEEVKHLVELAAREGSPV